MNDFRLAAFDMAGTTVDEDGLVYEILESTATSAAGCSVPPELLVAWKGTSKWEALEGILGELGVDNSSEVIDRHFAEFRTRLVAAYRDRPPAPIDGALETIAELRAVGVKVALQTGYSADIAHAILDGLNWTVGAGRGATVDALVTSDLVAASRPAPFLIFHCMEAAGVHDVRSVLTAGDTPNDVWAGYNAGAGLVIGVLSGSFDRAGLEGTPYTQLLGSIAEIPALL